MIAAALAIAGLLAVLGVPAAWAQMSAVPPEVADGVRQAGRSSTRRARQGSMRRCRSASPMPGCA